MRFNNQERIGVNATERIFIQEFNWIFREQPIVDVGIDALVEQAENGDPKGKFIALQIKSGKGNFHISEKKLTYYLSNIHYQYWLNFDMPVILIAHIPEFNETFWIEISKKNIKKSNKKWKLEIPKNNKLNVKAKSEISKLLSNRASRTINVFKGENIDNETVFEIAEMVTGINEAKESTLKTVIILEELTTSTNQYTDKFNSYNEKGIFIDSHQVKATLNGFARNLIISSKRLENECQIFSETFGNGIYGFEQSIILYLLFTYDISEVKSALNSLKGLPNALDSAIEGIQLMRNSMSKLPTDPHSLKLAKKEMLSIVDNIIDEYKTAKKEVENILEKFKEHC